MNLDDIDPTFVADLRASERAVERVARWLRERGYPVILRPTDIRPSAEQRAGYTDEGDLAILQTVEIKHRQFSFSTRESYPFPTAIVDNCAYFDKKRPRPCMYLLVNKEMTGALIVPVRDTLQHWRRERFFANGREKDIYVCPVEFTSYAPLM